MSAKRILLGEISSYKAIVIAKFLKESYIDIYLIGYDYKKITRTIHTKYCNEIVIVVSPQKNIQDHISSISKIIKEKEIELFIPVDSGTYDEYIKSKESFGESFNYIGEYNIYEQLHDKSKSSILASNLGIRIPKTFSSINEAKIPFVVKPTNLSSSKGVEYVFSEKKRNRIKINSKFILQEYVEGVGCGYSVFASKGNIVVSHGHLRLAEYPITGGSSVYRASFESQEMFEIAKKLLEETAWSGFAMFEFKLTPSNEIILIEVNPRIWGSINQGLQNGACYFKFLLGEPDEAIKRDVYTYLSPLLFQAFLKYFLKLQIKPILKFLGNVYRNSADISVFDDFKGYMSTILRKIL